MNKNQHKVIDYKTDNSAIEVGRSSIGIRKRGDRVEPKHMSPKEYCHYLYYQFNLNKFKSWNGIEKSDFSHNWEADESQCIADIDQALEYLNLCKTKNAPNGVERRTKERRSNNKDTRKNKSDRRTKKQRRQEESNNSILYFFAIATGFLIILITYGLMIKELMV